MDVAAPHHDRRLRSTAGGPGAGQLILASCIAFALALGSILATAFLMERPDASTRLADLWSGRAIRTIADADLPSTRPLPALRLAAQEGTDSTVTGSIDHRNDADASARILFGGDLGSAPTLAGLRELWQSTGASALQPDLRAVAKIKDVGGNHELRLLAGPFANAADASALCARLAARVPTCTVVPFSGQDLSNP
jgi:hypothetical protein